MTQTLAPSTDSLDLELLGGKSPGVFRVTRLIGSLPGVLIGDRLIIDRAGRVREGRWLAVVLPWSDEPIVARCVKGESGRLHVREPERGRLVSLDDPVRVLGVVVALTRKYDEGERWPSG